MKCLCCNKELDEHSTLEELQSRWHKSCVKKFFGTDTLPEIDVSNKVLEQLAIESTNKGYTVPGVQKKLSLHLSDESGRKPRLTLVNYLTGYILKPQTEDYRALPEAEFLVMCMASATKIKTVPFALLYSQDGKYSYITKRIDRVKKGKQTKLLAMEDFCQLDYRLTIDKYKGSYERCAKVIDKYSANTGIDKTELFFRLVFSFVVGNSDMHLKNFSLIETKPESGEYHLSDAYDLLPVNTVSKDKEQMALTLNGKKQNIRYKDFMVFAENSKINRKSAENMIKKIVSMKDTYLTLCQESYLPDDLKENLSNLIEERIKVIDRK